MMMKPAAVPPPIPRRPSGTRPRPLPPGPAPLPVGDATGQTRPSVARREPWIAIAVGVLAFALVGALVPRDRTTGPLERGVVRVVLTSQRGTGFFVAGPDDGAYVITAHHVVGNGEPIRI